MPHGLPAECGKSSIEGGVTCGVLYSLGEEDYEVLQLSTQRLLLTFKRFLQKVTQSGPWRCACTMACAP